MARKTRPIRPAPPTGWIPTQEQIPIEPPPSPRVGMKLDRGIQTTVERLRLPRRPRVGWHAVGLCLDWKLPVVELRRVWDVLDRNDPTGPYWQIVFRRRPG
jgi:hypothetical protein